MIHNPSQKSIKLFNTLEEYILKLLDQYNNQEVKQICRECSETFLILGNLFSDIQIEISVDYIYLENSKWNVKALKMKYLGLYLFIIPKSYTMFDYLII